MSAHKSIMPKGTRQAALMAFCLVACLFAWRGNVILGAAPDQAVATAPADTQHLYALLEPVLGQSAMRIASHTDADGARSVLVMVDAPDARFALTPAQTQRVETILAAATGFDPARDRLEIQPFAFASGTAGGFTPAQLAELGALAVIALLLGYVAFIPGTEPQIAPKPAANDPVAQPIPLPSTNPRTREQNTASQTFDAPAEAQRLARENPKRAASILKSWMNDGRQS